MENKPIKNLYRSRTNRVFFGIFGGLGLYLSIDPVILRLMYLLITVFTGIVPGIMVYLVGAMIVPEEPKKEPPVYTHAETTGEPKNPTYTGPAVERQTPTQ